MADRVGIRHFKAEVMPGEKADFVEALQHEGKVVAMVGDGINDSQALARADVSIAMGKGSDIAMDVAKVTLITSDLNVIPRAIALSRQTVRAIRQNLFWAFIYNIIGIPLAAGVLYGIDGFLLNPMIAQHPDKVLTVMLKTGDTHSVKKAFENAGYKVEEFR